MLIAKQVGEPDSPSYLITELTDKKDIMGIPYTDSKIIGNFSIAFLQGQIDGYQAMLDAINALNGGQTVKMQMDAYKAQATEQLT